MYKVLFPYIPQKDDEVELQDGDFVYVSTSDQGQTGEIIIIIIIIVVVVVVVVVYTYCYYNADITSKFIE